MADDNTLFPALDLSEVDETELTETVPSETKWTYIIDYKNRTAVVTDTGMPKKTTSYEEYLVHTAMKILNTERFQYAIYNEEIGVSKSEWPNWEDAEVKLDIEEALMSHAEIANAEVLSMTRQGAEIHLTISLTGLVGYTEMEETIQQ